jgi:hypothetical protein
LCRIGEELTTINAYLQQSAKSKFTTDLTFSPKAAKPNDQSAMVQKVAKVEKAGNIERNGIMKDGSGSHSTTSNDENGTIQDDHKPIPDTADTRLSVSGGAMKNQSPQ